MPTNPAIEALDARGRHEGFTLVEIAIVLVIVGLLLGGVLKGQEMITQVKIKNIVNDFNGITAAINSYQDRYKSLPGDDLGAQARWSTVMTDNSMGNGNGNGQFDTPNPAANKYNAAAAVPSAHTPESQLFWWHLRLAGFVGGSTAINQATSAAQPSNAVNGMMGVQTSGIGFTSNIICSSNMPDKIAIAVDTQMDDGTANSGQIRGQSQSGPSPDASSAAPTVNYTENGTNQYLLCKNL